MSGNLSKTDKTILDETAEAAAYLLTRLRETEVPSGGTRPGATTRISFETATQLTAAAVPIILQARLDVIRRS